MVLITTALCYILISGSPSTPLLLFFWLVFNILTHRSTELNFKSFYQVSYQNNYFHILIGFALETSLKWAHLLVLNFVLNVFFLFCKGNPCSLWKTLVAHLWPCWQFNGNSSSHVHISPSVSLAAGVP